MGSGSSRMGARSRSDHRSKLKFSTFLCGGASTSASSPHQVEDQISEKSNLPARIHDSVENFDVENTAKETPSESSSSSLLNEIKELSSLSSSSSGLDRTPSKSICNIGSTSSKPEHLEPLLTNMETSSPPVAEVVDSIQNSDSRHSSRISLLEPGDTLGNGIPTTEIHTSGSPPASTVSISSPIPNLLGEVGETRNGSVLHVDVVSISSNVLPSGMGELNSNERMRNNRRMFWDAFSRHSTRRHYEDDDSLGSHDRWLLDISDDLFGNSFDHDSMYFHRRSHGSNGRRWHSRSEIRERFRGGFHNGRRETTPCPSGLHPDGTCSCDSLFMHEESSARASISRIVMLAEALFEVLDEIHRQPISLSMVSLPAPESSVNSLPVKLHTKNVGAGAANDVEQCHICLAEYEEGDKIRVLPCRHEYHMLCVDRWLKEIHRICPLCRGDICEGTAENNAELTVLN